MNILTPPGYTLVDKKSPLTWSSASRLFRILNPTVRGVKVSNSMRLGFGAMSYPVEVSDEPSGPYRMGFYLRDLNGGYCPVVWILPDDRYVFCLDLRWLHCRNIVNHLTPFMAKLLVVPSERLNPPSRRMSRIPFLIDPSTGMAMAASWFDPASPGKSISQNPVCQIEVTRGQRDGWQIVDVPGWGSAPRVKYSLSAATLFERWNVMDTGLGDKSA